MTREEAIKTIENRDSIMDYCESAELGEALDVAIEALSNSEIPNKCGRWILGVNDNTCSICGEHSLTHWQSKFCPNCGVTMEGWVM